MSKAMMRSQLRHPLGGVHRSARSSCPRRSNMVLTVDRSPEATTEANEMLANGIWLGVKELRHTHPCVRVRRLRWFRGRFRASGHHMNRS